jgi:hypothetical protein
MFKFINKIFSRNYLKKLDIHISKERENEQYWWYTNLYGKEYVIEHYKNNNITLIHEENGNINKLYTFKNELSKYNKINNFALINFNYKKPLFEEEFVYFAYIHNGCRYSGSYCRSSVLDDKKFTEELILSFIKELIEKNGFYINIEDINIEDVSLPPASTEPLIEGQPVIAISMFKGDR